MNGDQDIQKIEHLIEQLSAFAGITSDGELVARLRLALGSRCPTDTTMSAAALFLILAHGNGEDESTPVSSSQSVVDLVRLASLIDDRVQIMQSVWRRLGFTISLPLDHKQVVDRVAEDHRFGVPKLQDLHAQAFAIIAKCENDVTSDDLELFVKNGQPTPFFYELIYAHLEVADGKKSRRSDAEDKIEDQADGDDIDDEDNDDLAREPVEAEVKVSTVETLNSYITHGQLNLKPAWQRKDVWSLKKKRELIRSLILGIPIPSIILHRQDKKISIIDGKQRLTAIVEFLGNKFKLPNFKVKPGHKLYDCSGAYWNLDGKKSLSNEIRMEVNWRDVSTLLFRDVPQGRLREIFNLYNVSGTRLNAAEIRNAVYQDNPIHRVAYVLAGEASEDLGTGSQETEKEFTNWLKRTLPSTDRYAAVAFICRYLGYSRVAQRPDVDRPGFGSTSTTINRYFDYYSKTENPREVAQEVIRTFRTAEIVFDVDDESSAFHRPNDQGQLKFNALVATTNLVATRMLLAAIDAGLLDERGAKNAVATLDVSYPVNQQTSTIWDYQARHLMRLRDTLAIDVEKLGEQWERCFELMEYARIPESESAA